MEPHRRAILDALREGDRSVSELVPMLQLAQPTVSKHLKALRERRPATVRPQAQRRYYRLRSEPLRELDTGLRPIERPWADRLDELGRHLDTQADLDVQAEQEHSSHEEEIG